MAVALLMLAPLDRHFFFVDPSADAFLWILGYGHVAFGCAVAGLALMFYAVFPTPLPRPTYRQRKRRLTLVLSGAALVAFAVGHQVVDPLLLREVAESTPVEREVRRMQPVQPLHGLAWRTRGDAPALALEIPRALFQGDTVARTDDGPLDVDLLLPTAGDERVRVTLYRDDSVRQGSAHRVDPEAPAGFWLDTRADGYRWLGLECANVVVDRARAAERPSAGCWSPEWPWQRYYPGAFGLRNVPVRMSTLDSGCSVDFRYRGRPVTISHVHTCLDPRGVRALASAVQSLDALRRRVR